MQIQIDEKLLVRELAEGGQDIPPHAEWRIPGAAMSKLEKRWDRLWPLACRVAHAIERYDGLARDDWTSMVALLDLTHAARALRRAVDELSPEESER